jgi:hypothetical protein
VTTNCGGTPTSYEVYSLVSTAPPVPPTQLAVTSK